MMFFQIRNDSLVTDDGVKYLSYGIDIFENHIHLRSIRDISLNKDAIADLVHRCNSLNASILHIDDIVEDFIQLCL